MASGVVQSLTVLERQKQVLELFCASQGWTYDVIADLGSGMSRNASRLCEPSARSTRTCRSPSQPTSTSLWRQGSSAFSRALPQRALTPQRCAIFRSRCGKPNPSGMTPPGRPGSASRQASRAHHAKEASPASQSSAAHCPFCRSAPAAPVQPIRRHPCCSSSMKGTTQILKKRALRVLPASLPARRSARSLRRTLGTPRRWRAQLPIMPER